MAGSSASSDVNAVMNGNLTSWLAAPYRLEVLAPDVGDAVRHAGGWMYDLVALGWAVIAMLPECSYSRPLQILGVQVAALDNVRGADGSHPPDAVATGAEARRDDDRIHGRVHDALQGGRSEVVLWSTSDDCALGSVRNARMVHYRLSRAACAFKAQALLALGASTDFDPVESFWSLTAFMTPASGLIPGVPADAC